MRSHQKQWVASVALLRDRSLANSLPGELSLSGASENLPSTGCQWVCCEGQRFVFAGPSRCSWTSALACLRVASGSSAVRLVKQSEPRF